MIEPLAVIVPAYNAEPTLAKVVKDVRRNLPGAWIIGVDDGSTDGSRNHVGNPSMLGDVRARKIARSDHYVRPVQCSDDRWRESSVMLPVRVDCQNGFRALP